MTFEELKILAIKKLNEAEANLKLNDDKETKKAYTDAINEYYELIKQ